MLQNLTLTRVIAHEVFQAKASVADQPVASSQLLELDEGGKELICKRLIDCIGNDSHCVPVDVHDQSESSCFQLVAGMFRTEPGDFVSKSASLAHRLTKAQVVGSIKDGVAVILQGTGWLESEELGWIAIIKADPDQGLVKSVVDGKVLLAFVNQLILSAQQRMVKVAFIIEEVAALSSNNEVRLPEDFQIRVYDHLMSPSGRSEAAQYFYGGFLGCRLTENSAKETRSFYEETRKCIDELSETAEQKIERRTHLVSYLKSERGVISAKEFADNYLPIALHHRYLEKMRSAKVPERGITKNNNLIKNRLRKQTLRFSSQVMLYAAPEAIQNDVAIVGVEDIEGNIWTKLRIRGTLKDQP